MGWFNKKMRCSILECDNEVPPNDYKLKAYSDYSFKAPESFNPHMEFKFCNKHGREFKYICEEITKKINQNEVNHILWMLDKFDIDDFELTDNPRILLFLKRSVQSLQNISLSESMSIVEKFFKKKGEKELKKRVVALNKIIDAELAKEEK